jgi:hypothetical protein
MCRLSLLEEIQANTGHFTAHGESAAHFLSLVANYLLDLKAFLLLSIMSTLPIPKIYRDLRTRGCTSASSAGETTQSLQGDAVSSERTVRQSASYFSNSDNELVYGSQPAEGNSTSRNSINSSKDEGAILPPLGSSLSDPQEVQRAEPNEIEFIGGIGVSPETGEENRTDTKSVHVRQQQETPSRTVAEPQQRTEIQPGEARISVTGHEPGIPEEQRWKELRQPDTPERNEKAEDRIENDSCEAWCCGCGRIEIFPQGRCTNCMSSFCSSCMRVD